MSEVWKFTLDVTGEQFVEMPADADLLHVAEQYGKLALWALVIPTGQRQVERRILVRGTGHSVWPFPYVGTVVTAGGSLVWHVFDGGEQPGTHDDRGAVVPESAPAPDLPRSGSQQGNK